MALPSAPAIIPIFCCAELLFIAEKPVCAAKGFSLLSVTQIHPPLF